jgi:hypothetical protein
MHLSSNDMDSLASAHAVPAAMQDGDFVDIFITPNAVYYTVHNNDNYASGSADDSGSDD